MILVLVRGLWLTISHVDTCTRRTSVSTHVETVVDVRVRLCMVVLRDCHNANMLTTNRTFVQITALKSKCSVAFDVTLKLLQQCASYIQRLKTVAWDCQFYSAAINCSSTR